MAVSHQLDSCKNVSLQFNPCIWISRSRCNENRLKDKNTTELDQNQLLEAEEWEERQSKVILYSRMKGSSICELQHCFHIFEMQVLVCGQHIKELKQGIISHGCFTNILKGKILRRVHSVTLALNKQVPNLSWDHCNTVLHYQPGGLCGPGHEIIRILSSYPVNISITDHPK